ncbi:MAG: hypothetical protein JWO46_1773 [Nocardioidaceae bacterium]|nr:hypothetical protein [Nocardioidaceae bacterium]
MKALLALLPLTVGALALVPQASAQVSAGVATGTVVVVQALPGPGVDVSIDGRSVRQKTEVGAVLGPFSMAPGTHELTFTGAGTAVKTKIDVGAGSSSDVVLHRPASVNGEPVVNTYVTPTAPIGPGKARLLLAHTATVAPADVSFDGSVVFRDIANGEFAQADVPAGSHRVALLPTGLTADPILGPLQVTLAARTVTMVYAVGNPSDKSMKAIVHTVDLPTDGSTAPETIKTGSAGLAGGIPVDPFGARVASRSARGQHPVR